MIVVQTPLRVSLFGGGTDFREFFEAQGGFALSTAIDKYIFVVIKGRFDNLIRVGYTRTEMVAHPGEVQHELVREALSQTGIDRGIEIGTLGDIPAAGSGLGSSSTVTVGLLHAMYAYQGRLVSAEQLAQEACQIEIDRLEKPIGVQDQYIAAYGGLRLLQFGPGADVRVQRVNITEDTKRRLNENLMLFFTGITRQSSSVLAEQKTNINARLEILCRIKAQALEAYHCLEAGNLDGIGELLDETWQLKKQMASGISNGVIEEMYQSARQAGAIGGKISGAGGGGFLLLYCAHRYQDKVREALAGLQELSFNFENEGTKVIFNYQRS
jgi:D-glycero-alpha-D-manno-heptose-7-phosphate kinase